MNENLRKLFPALANLTYLNSAAVAPLPEPSANAVMTQLTDVSRFGSMHFQNWVNTKERCRVLLSSFLNAQPEQIAFMRNTSDAISAVANGIDWKPGDNIVTFDREFPSNFYPWRMVRDDFGVELRMVSENDGRIDLDEFVSLIDANTKVVAISAVQFASGFRADLERIGREARKHNALFFVDVIQLLGADVIDLPSQFVDIAAGASHKWLCAPEGCGFLYLSDRARNVLKPKFVGWISVEDPWNFEAREQSFKPNALALESGTGPSSLFYGLEQSLLLLKEYDPAQIQKYLLDLTDQFVDEISGKNYDLVSSRLDGEKSQIVCIKPRNGRTSSEIARELESNGIVISPRGERLRIAPHFFNTAEDISKLAEAL